MSLNTLNLIQTHSPDTTTHSSNTYSTKTSQKKPKNVDPLSFVPNFSEEIQQASSIPLSPTKHKLTPIRKQKFNLNTELSRLSKSLNSLKAEIHQFEHSENQTVDTIKIAFEKFNKIYSNLNHRAVSLTDRYNKMEDKTRTNLLDLNDQVEKKKEDILVNSQASIASRSRSLLTQNSVNSRLEKDLSDRIKSYIVMEFEFNVLASQWTTIKSNLSFIAMKVDSLGYTIMDNNGVTPSEDEFEAWHENYGFMYTENPIS